MIDDGGAVDGSDARRAAQAELAHREYHRDDPGLVDRTVHWAGRQLAHLFTGGGGAHALLIVIVAVLVVVVALAVRAGAPTVGHRSAGAPDSDPLRPVGARDHRALAERLQADGRSAEAMREWLRAAVATIEERGVLPPRPGRTGATTAREAGALMPDAAADLQAAMAAFDAVWFGGRPAGAQDADLARRAADAVARARIVTGPPPAPGLAVPR